MSRQRRGHRPDCLRGATSSRSSWQVGLGLRQERWQAGARHWHRLSGSLESTFLMSMGAWRNGSREGPSSSGRAVFNERCDDRSPAAKCRPHC